MSKLSPKLSPWLSELHKQIEESLANGYKATAIGAREGLANVVRSLIKESPAIAWVNEDLVPGAHYNVPVRIYHPEPEEARPVLVFYHGGGHMAGSVSVYDPICRKLADASGHIVVSAEYRRAPENPYPAGVIDAYAVASKVFDLLRQRGLKFRNALAIAGDSAGAALAATVSWKSQFDTALVIEKQILIYPCLDYTMSHKSIYENGENYFLTRERIAWYFNNYFQHAEDRCAASPLHGHFSAGLPKTLLVSAGFDPLRDEAFAYVEKLEQAGVANEHLHFEDMVHAFLFMEDLIPEECQRLYLACANFLNEHKSN